MTRDLLKEAREAKTIQDGLIALIGNLRRHNSSMRNEIQRLGGDVAAADQAAELLDQMEAEGAAALEENVDFQPSQS